jgi:RNA polymerase sigma-70 factor (ECF subfamily)
MAEKHANNDSAALMSRVLDEPRQGIALLYDRFARDVNRLVYRILGPDVEHDDIVQQIFLQMIQSIGNVREPERLSFWVRSICVNVVRSELRKRAVRRAFLRSAPPPESGDLSIDVEAADFLSRSSDVLDRLSAQERVVFVLYYLEEHSLPEIAEVCGFSARTAKRRLSHARERFRKHMTRDACLTRLIVEEGLG